MALSSSMHGLSNIVRVKGVFYKLMWTVFYVTAITGFLVLMNTNLSNYNKHEIVTKIETFTTKSLEFPSITICIEDFDSNSSKFI